MKGFRLRTAIMLLPAVLALPILSWAATSTAQATVSATIPVVATISLARDTNSITTRGSASQVVFNKTDAQDTNVPQPNPGYMYAPYRSETNKNWHVANIVASGSSMTLTASVTGTVGTTPLANVMRVWCGGFFLPGATAPISGTATSDDSNPATDDWELLSTFKRNLSRAFVGVVPFNYRLDIGTLPGGGPYAGTITFTLTTT